MVSGMGGSFAYDGGNRLVSATAVSGGTEYYGYAPDGKRIYTVKADGTEEWTLFGGRGEELGTFARSGITGAYVTLQSVPVWFAGRIVGRVSPAYGEMGPVFPDRLGTERVTGARRKPYGEDAVVGARFATYSKDGFSGLLYADQRWYAGGYGRFTSADPYGGSASQAEPGSWNRYAYVEGDPVNWTDRHGTNKEAAYSVTVDAQYEMMNPFLYWLMSRGYGGSSYESYSGNAGSSNSSGSSTPYDGKTFSRDMGAAAVGVISNMPAKCREELGRKWNLFDGSSSFLAKATSGGFNFYDGRTAAVANSPIQSWGWKQGGTVGEILNQDPKQTNFTVYALVSQYRGAASNDLFLGANWFTLSEHDASQVLLHELLHSYTGMNDVVLGNKLGLGEFGENDTINASSALTDFFKHDCLRTGA